MTSSSEFVKIENADTNVRAPVEKDKRFLIRQQLYYLFHAFRCTRLAYTTGQGDCQNQHCIMMRNVVKHIPQCNQGKDCKFPHCPSSKEIIKHWKNCNDVECQVCAPLRRNSNNNRKTENTINNQFAGNNRQIGDDDWKSKIWRIREKLVLKLTDDILPVKVCEDVRNHPNYLEVVDYVKHFESDSFQQSDSLHMYICQVSEKFERIYQQLLPKRCARENENSSVLFNSLNESPKVRLEKFYCIIKEDIEKFYITIGGNPRELFDQNTVPFKDEKIMKIENDFNQNHGSSESSLKTASSSSDSNSIIKQEPLESPSNSIAITVSKSISSSIQEATTATPVTDTKMSPDSTTFGPNKDVSMNNYHKKWTKDEIIELFGTIHQDLVNEKDSEPFRLPVDWKLLDIPDYPLIIKNPIDLSTIHKKMINGDYSNPWNVVDDYWLMFNNAWLYNKKTSKVYKMCNTLAKIFETKIDDIMTACGYCCGREYVYLPQVLICCTPNVCLIVRDAAYYAFQNDKSNGVSIIADLTCDKYICCEKCFNDNPEEIPFLNVETNVTCKVKKTMLIKCRNNVKDNEEFVFCRTCNRKWHRVCANHVDEVWRDGFTCPTCIAEHNIKMKDNPYKARYLPHNELSKFIEDRVNTFLREKDPTVNEVVIRVLSSSDKTVEVKPGMKSHYCETGEMAESFNYRLKAIFAFQEIDGQEVCFFGLHVQEYGSDCPDPNSRRVYIAYLDSVHYFTPRSLRTDVYHEFLVGYLEYVKKLGFSMAHIWACPPGEGDDYIFHMHPPEQKLPKPKRLQEWYIKMLDKAMKENIVCDYKDIFSDALQSKMLSPTELPYFEGDYWPNALEDIFKEIDEEANKRLKSYSESSSITNDIDGSHKDVISKNNLSKMDKKPKKRKLKRMNSINNKRKRTNCSESINDVSKRVLELMEKRKENFFVIRLHSQAEAATLLEIRDPDPIVGSDLMDGRDKFLCLARERHLEFSSLRRARYSSLMFCYELHMEQRHSVLYTCNCCGRHIELRWTCRQCDDFELCESCYSRESHPHPLFRVESEDIMSDQAVLAGVQMTTSSSMSSDTTCTNTYNNNNLSNSISPSSNQLTTSLAALTTNNTSTTSTTSTTNASNQQTNDIKTNNNMTNNENNNGNNSNLFPQNADLQDTTRARMVRYSQSLLHACHCRDANCRINFCSKMKVMIKHLQCCAVTRNTCKTCMSFLRICAIHAKFCNDPKCQVPNCLNYRFNWKQQGSQQRMQQAQMLRRRVALMQRGTSISGTNDNNANPVIPTTSNSAIINNANEANNFSSSINTNTLKTSSSTSNLENMSQSMETNSSMINNRLNPGKVADPIHEEMIKQQQIQQQMPNHLTHNNSHGHPQMNSMLINNGYNNNAFQYSANMPLNNNVQLSHNMLPQQQQQQFHPHHPSHSHLQIPQQHPSHQMMENTNPNGNIYSNHLQHNPNIMMQPMNPPTMNNGGGGNMSNNPNMNMMSHYGNVIPNNGNMNHLTNLFSEEDIKIVRHKYFQLKTNPNPEEFKRQLLEFLSTNPRYKAAFEYLMMRSQPVVVSNRRLPPGMPSQQTPMVAQATNSNGQMIINQNVQHSDLMYHSHGPTGPPSSHLHSQHSMAAMYHNHHGVPPQQSPQHPMHPSNCYPQQSQQPYFISPNPNTQSRYQHQIMLPPPPQSHKISSNNPSNYRCLPQQSQHPPYINSSQHHQYYNNSQQSGSLTPDHHNQTNPHYFNPPSVAPTVSNSISQNSSPLPTTSIQQQSQILPSNSNSSNSTSGSKPTSYSSLSQQQQQVFLNSPSPMMIQSSVSSSNTAASTPININNTMLISPNNNNAASNNSSNSIDS